MIHSIFVAYLLGLTVFFYNLTLQNFTNLWIQANWKPNILELCSVTGKVFSGTLTLTVVDTCQILPCY